MAKGKAPGETKSLQNAFLAAYNLVGSVRKAAESVDMSRNTVSGWIKNDVQGFRERYEDSKDEFREYLQDMAVDRVKDQKPGDNPVLLITLLNAHWPEKYRRTGYYTDNAAKEIMSEWKKWIKQTRKQAKTKDEAPDRNNAIEEAERILARKATRDSDA